MTRMTNRKGAVHAAGALLAGSPQHVIAAHFIDILRDRLKKDRLNAQGPSSPHQFRGVAFYASKTTKLPKSIEGAGWCIMDLQKQVTSKSRSPIHEADAFVLFDEARCRYAPHITAQLSQPLREILVQDN